MGDGDLHDRDACALRPALHGQQQCLADAPTSGADLFDDVMEVVESPAFGPMDFDGYDRPESVSDLAETFEESEELRERIIESVEEGIGKFSRPSNVLFVDELPKTRSGKIMRRLLEDISNDEELGNTSTLADPSVPETIRDQLQAD